MVVNSGFCQLFITGLEILERHIYKNINSNISQIQEGGKKESNSSILFLLFQAFLKPGQRQLGYAALNCFPIIAYFGCT